MGVRSRQHRHSPLAQRFLLVHVPPPACFLRLSPSHYSLLTSIVHEHFHVSVPNFSLCTASSVSFPLFSMRFGVADGGTYTMGRMRAVDTRQVDTEPSPHLPMLCHVLHVIDGHHRHGFPLCAAVSLHSMSCLQQYYTRRNQATYSVHEPPSFPPAYAGLCTIIPHVPVASTPLSVAPVIRSGYTTGIARYVVIRYTQ